MKTVPTMKAAQKFVKSFAQSNGWTDIPNILRYKSEKDRIKAIKEHKDEFVDGVGGLFFGLCRLANQLQVDIDEAFNLVKDRVLSKYNGARSESKLRKK